MNPAKAPINKQGFRTSYGGKNRFTPYKRKTPLYKAPSGPQMQTIALRQIMEPTITIGDDLYGQLRTQDIVMAPLFTRMRNHWDRYRFLSMAVKFEPTEQPHTLLTYNSYDDVDLIQTESIFMRQQSLKIKQLKDQIH